MKNNKYTGLLFYLTWLIISIIQAHFTELLGDEAYYWKYSQHLAWGYFDHPPFIALIIKIGYWIFQNELGVRLIPILLNTLTIYLLEILIKPKDKKLFYILILSVAIVHLSGFMAIPDTPLIFLTVLFYLMYRRFLAMPNAFNALLLGINIALLLLTKYHGVLIIILTLISNLRLLKKQNFWFTILVSIILFLPHLLWQYSNNFPSVQFHLLERSNETYNLSYTLEYIFTQPFVFGPLIGLLILFAAFRYHYKNVFERTLLFNYFGVYIFFLIMTFKGRVEAHWTYIAFIPGLFIGYKYISSNNTLKKIVYYAFPFTIMIIVLVRLFLMWNFLPSKILPDKISYQYHQKAIWVKKIKQKAGNNPVAFMNSYTHASLYEFYTGSTAFSLNNVMYRKNQYDLWNYEDSLRGQNIMLIPNYPSVIYDTLKNTSIFTQYKYIKNFQSYSKIKITPLDLPKKTLINDTIKIELDFKHPDNKRMNIEANDIPSHLYCIYFKGKKRVKQQKLLKLTNQIVNQHDNYSVDIIAPSKRGTYDLCLSIKTGYLEPTINSNRYKLEVKKPVN